MSDYKGTTRSSDATLRSGNSRADVNTGLSRTITVCATACNPVSTGRQLRRGKALFSQKPQKKHDVDLFRIDFTCAALKEKKYFSPRFCNYKRDSQREDWEKGMEGRSARAVLLTTLTCLLHRRCSFSRQAVLSLRRYARRNLNNYRPTTRRAFYNSMANELLLSGAQVYVKVFNLTGGRVLAPDVKLTSRIKARYIISQITQE